MKPNRKQEKKGYPHTCIVQQVSTLPSSGEAVAIARILVAQGRQVVIQQSATGYAVSTVRM